MKYLVLILMIVLAIFALPEVLFSQPPSFPENPPQVPIDGGLTALAAGGAAYAINKLRKRKPEH